MQAANFTPFYQQLLPGCLTSCSHF